MFYDNTSIHNSQCECTQLNLSDVASWTNLEKKLYSIVAMHYKEMIVLIEYNLAPYQARHKCVDYIMEIVELCN